jgi:hypothetical protein
MHHKCNQPSVHRHVRTGACTRGVVCKRVPWKGGVSMTFGQKARFLQIAERHDTIEYTEYDESTYTLYVYFANGESWVFQVRSV